jgi:CHASE3 domain sensor protein
MKTTLKQKIFFAGSLWALLSLIVAFVVNHNLRKSESSEHRVLQSTQMLQSFNNLLTIMIDMETGIRGFLLSGDDIYLEPFNAAEGKFDQQAREMDPMIADRPEFKQHFDKIKAIKQEWIEGPAVETMMARKKLTRGMINQEQFVEIFKNSKSRDLNEKIRGEVKEVTEKIRQEIANLSEEQTKNSKMTFYSAIGGLPLGILLGFGLLAIIIIRVDRQIKAVVRSLAESSEKVFEASQALLSSGGALSENANLIANHFQDTSQSVKMLTEMTSKNNEHAQVAFRKTQESSQTAQKGDSEITQLITAMKEISQSSKKIEEISQLIDDIAFQTNLLALNAAVEAARAGEHGKGFAVVAEAVQSLAQRSAVAAKEIKDLIQESVRSAQSGTELADRAGIVFQDIIRGVSQVNQLVSDVSSGSQHQSQEIVEISSALQQVETQSQSNLMISKELGDFSQHLGGHSQNLKVAVDQLTDVIGRSQAANL